MHVACPVNVSCMDGEAGDTANPMEDSNLFAVK